MEVSNWKSQAQDWLAALGYPYASIETPMDDRIGLWWDYYRTEADFYTHEQQDINGKPHKVKVRSMTPGKMVCEDMAGLLFNERATISTAEDDALKSADDWLQKWLGDVRFQDRAPQLIQRTCATGTGAWALHLRGVQTMGKSAMLS
ncbi:MAG: hypothetical protein RSB04_12385, partial [Gordonibacter sp.]|uniref:hypothetical protein n=1 Tax=Gordonibacter sp. TaxID=1968902 RepID=UPI002FC9E963